MVQEMSVGTVESDDPPTKTNVCVVCIGRRGSDFEGNFSRSNNLLVRRRIINIILLSMRISHKDKTLPHKELTYQ